VKSNNTIRLTIYRFDPEKDKAPRFEKYSIPQKKGMTILDTLLYVYENIDHSLSFNYGCRYGRCGVCAINVNGKPVLICQTQAMPEMLMEPLPNYPVVRDLVIERASFGDRTMPFDPFLRREDSSERVLTVNVKPDTLSPSEFDTFCIVTRCVDCYSCNSICPVIGVTHDSKGGPNLLMQMAPYLFDPRDSGKRTEMMEELSKICLLCGTCAENCPKNLPIDEIIAKVRAELVEKKGLPYAKSFVLRTLLQSPRLLSLLIKGGSLLRGLIFKRIPAESGLQLRFPVGGMDSRRILPEMAKHFFLETAPRKAQASKEKETVAFFVGCSINYLYPHIGEATIRVLNRRGISVLIPKEQKCCGLPAYGSGDIDTARKLALDNIEVFEKSGAKRMVIACASGSAHLKVTLPKIFANADETLKVRVSQFCNSITDLTVYLSSLMTGKEITRDYKRLKVTYHDSCHMKRKLGIMEEPRTILKSVADFVEMDNADQCCGMAGSFGLENYELSAKILESKMSNAERTGAEVLATTCMGCLMQLEQGIHNHHLKAKAMHVVEILDEAESSRKKID